MDDYHHYSDLKDYQILEGLSGAPVFSDNNTLIGMNQSIPYLENEGNPFKNIYFITLKHIMNYLRESGCILFEQVEDSLEIRWLKERSDQEEDLSVLVIGGSGAGKSSFIKSFALNRDKINSSGDGQTTRTEVEYIFTRFEKKPNVEVLFHNREDFCQKRKDDIWFDIISFMFVNYFGFKELDIYEDHLCYMKELNAKLHLINEEKQKSGHVIGSKIINITSPLIINKGEIDNIIIVENYLSILSEITNLEKEIKCMKIFDDDFLQDIEFELLKMIEFKDLANNNEDDGLRQIINYGFKDVISDVQKKGRGIEQKSKVQNKIVRRIYHYSYPKERYICKDKHSLKKQLEKILYEKKGFFSVHEFDFLFEKGEGVKSQLKTTSVIRKSNEKEKMSLYKRYTGSNDVVPIYINNILDFICTEIMDQNSQNKENFFGNDLDIFIEDVFSCFYETIQKQFQLLGIKGKLVFKLNDLNTEKQNLLSKCLKTVAISKKSKKGNLDIRIDSLTSMIRKVTITDSFSNEFALMFDDLNIKSITFVDTYGLDHIEKGVSKKRLLKDFFTEQKENREKRLNTAKQGIDAVLYLKKLDSGRPTELDYIVPLIYEVEPQVTLYCIFTGIDIFNLKNKEVNTSWKLGDVNAPKAVQYLFSSELKQALDKKLKFSTGKKTIVYQTLRTNIGAFCGTGNPKFNVINKERMRKILISILIKEKNSIDIIPEELIEELESKESESYKRIKEEVKELLIMFFDKSSITNWKDMRWNTIRANAKRVNGEYIKENQLGYSGVHRHRWDMIFQECYNEIFSNERYTKRLVEVFTSNREKVESVLISMRDNFLGKNKEIYDRKPLDSNEVSFKKQLENLYIGEEKNPFNNSSIRVGHDTKDSQEYLNEVLNFRRLIAKGDNLDKFADLYIQRLLDSLIEDRNSSIDNVLKYGKDVDANILSAYREINRIFHFNEESRDQAISILDAIVSKVIKDKSKS
ncbi:hypothetical protein [Chengkuizengella axinellae]|uniref:G domain-containing protein n=1 Tax=Chengkuizengella axinellae TaxID=3064388 RepID=A0ABT9J5B8_9BACL|nr:hypothetical protein [Chengkuizengella sp. 2205SS18-9]MDP5276195.1 hypothetical protein [Chengkuizengella sp. 2205SS18-9]